ncbi:MAG: hypothetical protein AB7G44_04980 [Bacteroidia bacterium]
MPKGIKIHERQSLKDLAVQYYGNVTGIVDLFAQGIFNGFNDIPVIGAKLLPGTAVNKSVAEYYSGKRITVATARAGLVGGGFNDGFDDGFDIGEGYMQGGSFNEGFDNGFEIFN